VKLWPTNKHFDEKNFDEASYFQHAVGITVHDGDPEHVLLSFTPRQGKYVKSQPIHSSQEIVEDNNDECRVSLHVVINPELTMTLLSYGSQVKVLKPAHLAEKMAEEAKAMATLYK
jgi:predicted DNA-binding transcriptional regulator YafY